MATQQFLFKQNTQPLADRMRPNTLDDFVGQGRVVGAGTILLLLINTSVTVFQKYRSKTMTKKQIKKTARAVDYHETLLERLKKHDYAVAYLNAAIEESLKGDAESQQLFLQALRNVAEAHGSMSDLAKRAQLRRESLYRMLSKKGNPELASLASVLHAMGFSLSVR